MRIAVLWLPVLSFCAFASAALAEPLTEEHQKTIERAAQGAREGAISARYDNRQFWTKHSLGLCDNIRGIVAASDAKESNYWRAVAEYCYGFVIVVSESGSAGAIKRACPHLKRAHELAKKAIDAGEEVTRARILLNGGQITVHSRCFK